MFVRWTFVCTSVCRIPPCPLCYFTKKNVSSRDLANHAPPDLAALAHGLQW